MRVSQEFYTRIFRLTAALYRVTDLLSEKETLRYTLREKANRIFEYVVESLYVPEDRASRISVVSELQTLLAYIRLLDALGLVNPLNVQVLEREYKDALDQIRSSADAQGEKIENAPQIISAVERGNPSGNPGHKKTAPRPVSVRASTAAMRERQGKILEHLRQTNQANVPDLLAVFKDVSSKTIQRDLQDLVSRRAVKKQGSKKWTLYSIVSDTQAL